MSERKLVLEDMIGKRSIIAMVNARGRVDMTEAEIKGVDDQFAKIESKTPNHGGIIVPNIVTCVPLTSVISVIDATDDKIYDMIINDIKQQETAMAQAQAAAQKAKAKAETSPDLAMVPKKP